jgi:hypothetical protein
MRTLLSLTLFLLILPFLFQQEAFAQKASSVQCVTCHKTAMKILPEDHKGYKLEATALCFGCHRPEGKAKPLGEKIHGAHLQKAPAAMKNCLACHRPDKKGEVLFPGYPGMKATKDGMAKVPPFFTSWTNSPFLDHSHQQKGVYCLNCHSDYMDEYAAGDTQAGCVKCHGDYDAMINKTAKTKYENNPHKSHFVDLKCSACHHSHKEFEDNCGKCHSFGYKAPK